MEGNRAAAKANGFLRPMGGFATLLLSLVWASTTTPLLGQQNVQATLAASTGRPPAPPFDLVGENGKEVRLSDYRGKVVLLNFWATGCGGCVLEIPSLSAIEKTYEAQGFTAVGVSMDITYENLKDADEAWEKVKPFIPSHGINYPVLMGNESILEGYALRTLPASYLLDKSGRVAAIYMGVVSKESVEANVKELLSEKP